MVFICLALIALNVAQYALSTRREQRLIDAVMSRNAGEYAAIRRADAPTTKPKPRPEPDEAPELTFPIGM